MTFNRTTTDASNIADLLEREEKKAKDIIRRGMQGALPHDRDGDVLMGGPAVVPARSLPLRPARDVEPTFRRDPQRLERPEDLDNVNHRGRTRRSGHDKHPSHHRYLSEREENDDRRTRRSRGAADDEAINGGSDKDSANGSVRSNHRSRSPEGPNFRRNDRSREKFKGDSYRGPGYSSTSRDDFDSYRPNSDHHYPDNRRRSRERGGAHRRGRDDHRDAHRAPYSRGVRDGYGPRLRRTPEPTDDERDKRTVFVQQLSHRLRTSQLREFFEQAGRVVDAQIVKDRVSNRSKGVGYVEFREEASVQKAIQLTGQKLCEIPIIAQLTEAEKNRQARTTEGVATQSNGVPFHRLYVGNIHFSITEDDLRDVFEPFGELEFVTLQKDDATGRSKGYGFVQFINPTEAKEALEKMNGFELASRPIRVGLGNDKFTPESTNNLLARFGAQAQSHSHSQAHTQTNGSAFSGAGGRGAHAGGTGNFDRLAARDVDKTGGASALDDTDVTGVPLTSVHRGNLMRKLLRTDEPDQRIVAKTQVKAAVAAQPTATRCVILKNMYNQAAETEPNWQKLLEDDVKTECNEKYGKVVHIGLALDNNDGEVYVKFDRIEGGRNAIYGLNGRMFGGYRITASYVVDAVYHMIFPKAANV